MKTKVDAGKFAEAMAAVKGLVMKDTLSPFSRVRIDAPGRNVSVTASDGNRQMTWRFEGETSEPGCVTVAGVALAQFAAAMPLGGVEIETTATRLVMKGQGTTYRMAVAGNELPAMAGLKDGGAAKAVLDGALLKELFRKTKYAVSGDATRKALGGICFAMRSDGRLWMTATDGRRLAHAEAEVDVEVGGKREEGRGKREEVRGKREEGRGESGGVEVILDAMTARMLHTLAKEGERVEIAADRGAVMATGEQWCLTSRVIDEKYPDWSRAVPETEHAAKVDVGRFLLGLKRAALAADRLEGDSMVDVALTKDGMEFSASGTDMAAKVNFVAGVDFTGDAKSVEFTVNPKLMQDALESIDEDTFELGYDSGTGPLKLTVAGLPWVAVVMPYRKEG